jgi:hypothetical protein
MSNVIFQVWLFAFLILFPIGPLVVLKGWSLIKKISERNPDWVATDTSGFFAFFSPRGISLAQDPGREICRSGSGVAGFMQGISSLVQPLSRRLLGSARGANVLHLQRGIITR